MEMTVMLTGGRNWCHYAHTTLVIYRLNADYCSVYQHTNDILHKTSEKYPEIPLEVQKLQIDTIDLN